MNIADRNLELPRTWSFNFAIEQALSESAAVTLSLQHARTDNLFRFVDRNAAELGAPFAEGANALGTVTVTESSARSRYNAVTLGLHGDGALDGRLSFETNYTLGFDRSDDDNERDPFNFFYATATDFEPEYNWSIRDRRHQLTGFALFDLGRGVVLNHVFRYLSASPMSESCGPTAANPLAAPAGQRAGAPADRVCADGSVLKRNTLRRENDFFTWDLRLSKAFDIGGGRTVEPILEVFNLTGADNFLDTAQTGLLFNFDGTIRSGLGDTRRAQLGVRVRF